MRPGSSRIRKDAVPGAGAAVCWCRWATDGRLPPAVEAVFVLPAAFAALLVVGALAAGLHGRLGAAWVLGLVSLLLFASAAVSELLAAAPLAVVGWLTVVGFSRPPYAQLQAHGTHPVRTALVVGVCAAAGGAAGATWRWVTRPERLVTLTLLPGSTLDDVKIGMHRPERRLPADFHAALRRGPAPRRDGEATGLGPRRQLTGLALVAGGLPALTAVLAAVRSDLALVDDLLLYLVAVIAITCVGGFWPAVAGAITSSLLLNWYFTPPLHTWTIDAPENIFALLLFVTAAVSVSSVVHVAARRAATARRATADASTLLELARTVLAGRDRAQDVVEQMQSALGGGVELQELVSGRWVTVAHAGLCDAPIETVEVRPDLQLQVHGRVPAASGRVLAGFAAQAAAALDRERLRVQAEQAEVFAAGNRMRNALLAAVSHDLRTPLASVKAAISSLRQRDVAWSEDDQAVLLATAEDGTDRLDGLIANLLDMSRVQTGTLQPFLRPTSVDEIAPLALRGHDSGEVRLNLPEGLPMVSADPGLLERALANLVDNAARYSPPGEPARVTAHVAGDSLHIAVIDHGPGVPHAMRERMFEPFQQLGDQRNSTGVGLGLAVARGFVDALGGNLSATPTAGGGLTMTVRLTVAANADTDVAADQ